MFIINALPLPLSASHTMSSEICYCYFKPTANNQYLEDGYNAQETKRLL